MEVCTPSQTQGMPFKFCPNARNLRHEPAYRERNHFDNLVRLVSQLVRMNVPTTGQISVSGSPVARTGSNDDSSNDNGRELAAAVVFSRCATLIVRQHGGTNGAQRWVAHALGDVQRLTGSQLVADVRRASRERLVGSWPTDAGPDESDFCISVRQLRLDRISTTDPVCN